MIAAFLRHAQTHDNLHRRISKPNGELTDAGRMDTSGLAQVLLDYEFDAVYSSEHSRTRETAARATGHQYEIHPLACLNEINMGTLHGKRFAALPITHPKTFLKLFLQTDESYRFGGGESLGMFTERVQGCLQWLAENHNGQSILACTSKWPMKIIHSACSREHKSKNYQPKNLDILLVEYKNPVFELVREVSYRIL